jgi:hypothetical protein
MNYSRLSAPLKIAALTITDDNASHVARFLMSTVHMGQVYLAFIALRSESLRDHCRWPRQLVIRT